MQNVTPRWLLAALLLVSLGCSSSSVEDDVDGGPVYERLKGLSLAELGNAQIVYSTGGSGLYTITTSKDGTFTSHTSGNTDRTSGTWTTDTTTLFFNEDGGDQYSIVTTDGVIRSDSQLIGKSGFISGVFGELVGTGSGLADFGFLQNYRVELAPTTGEPFILRFDFRETTVTYRQLEQPAGEVKEAGVYTWTFNGMELGLTLTEATVGSPLDQLVLNSNDDWFVEGEPATVATGTYTVSNVDYLR